MVTQLTATVQICFGSKTDLVVLLCVLNNVRFILYFKLNEDIRLSKVDRH